MTIVNIYFYSVLLYGCSSLFIRPNLKSALHGKRDVTFFYVIIPAMLTLMACYVENVTFGYSITNAQLIFGIILSSIATVVNAKARIDIKNGYSMLIEKLDDHKLITTGIYKYIRHPIYTAVLLITLSACIALEGKWSLILFLMTIGGLNIRIKNEEKFLLNTFPEYTEYSKKVKRLIPFIY
jgi:protein-S-isoprenylcysteine O-methyltransferase Ste14